MPYLTVFENVMLPLTIIKASRKHKRALVENALSQVGLLDKADRLPNQISGGEKERVAIARAVVNEPPVLLADEPTGNLDTKTSAEIMKLLQRLNTDGHDHHHGYPQSGVCALCPQTHAGFRW